MYRLKYYLNERWSDYMDNKDALLVEYQCCYNKLDMISNIQNVLFMFAITCIGTLLAYSIQQRNLYVPIVGYMILLLIKCRLIYYRDEYYINYAYIIMVIEPQLGINSFIKEKIKVKVISNIHYFTCTILAIGIFLTYLIFYTDDYIFLLLSIFLTIVIIALDLYFFVFTGKKWYRKIINFYKELINGGWLNRRTFEP